MMRYFARRVINSVLVMAGVIVLVFFLFQGFGDPSRLVLGQTADKQTQENIRRELHLDQPKWKQFILYVNDVSPISIHSESEIKSKDLTGIFIGGQKKLAFKLPYLRRSYQSNRKVGEILMNALPGTLLLAFAAMLIAVCVGIPLGVIAAIKKDTWIDTTAIVTSILGISAPSFFIGILIAYFFGFVLSEITGLHMTGSLFEIDPFKGKTFDLRNLVLPAITLGIRPLAIIAQLTRSAMLDVLNQDYIRTARAKGLDEKVVIWKHALRNALNPVITAVTGWFAELLAGAFFVEYIFGWQGIGKVTVDALEKLDFPVVMGSVLVSSLFFVIINILADVLYSATDPRIART